MEEAIQATQTPSQSVDNAISSNEWPDATEVLNWLKAESSWISEDKIQIVEFVRNRDYSKLRFKLYTAAHVYSISAEYGQASEKDYFHNYLGCGGSTRYYRAGEDWTRGNDLPDGKLTKETFRNILGAIVGYELVKLESARKPIVGIGVASAEEAAKLSV